MFKLINKLGVIRDLFTLSFHSIFNSLIDIFIFFSIGKLIIGNSNDRLFDFIGTTNLYIILLVTIIIRLISNLIFEKSKSSKTWGLYQNLAINFVIKKLNEDFWYHKGADKGVLLRKFTKDIPNVSFVYQSLINMCTDTFFAVTIILFLIGSQPAIALVLLPTIFIISLLIKKSLESKIKQSSAKRLKSDEFIKKWILAFKSSLEQVKSISSSSIISNRIIDQIKLRFNSGKAQVYLTNVTRVASENSILFMIILGVIFLPQEKHKELVWILPLMVRIIPNISRINTSISSINFYKKEVDDILEELNCKIKPPLIFKGSINCDKDSFNVLVEELKYKIHDKPLIKDSKFIIPLKNVTFLSGPSGSGKSTLARVIVDETKNKKNNFVFLPQLPTIFPETLKFNVSLNNEDSDIEVSRILESVNLIPKFEGLTLNSLISDDDLSGGQMQRISIARSIYYKGKNIILDEPTNNLDKKAKMELKNVIYNLIKLDNTFLIITHDLDFINLFKNPNIIKM